MLDARLPSIESTPPAPAAMDASVRPSRQEAEAAVRTLIRWAGGGCSGNSRRNRGGATSSRRSPSQAGTWRPLVHPMGKEDPS
jgi:hypothetical protein